MEETFERPVSPIAAEAISSWLAVLAQPLRVRLIDLLDLEGEAAVGDLADALGARLHNVSQHLALLRSAALVNRRHRGREVLYRLATPAALSVYDLAAHAVRDEAERLERAVERHG